MFVGSGHGNQSFNPACDFTLKKGMNTSLFPLCYDQW